MSIKSLSILVVVLVAEDRNVFIHINSSQAEARNHLVASSFSASLLPLDMDIVSNTKFIFQARLRLVSV